MNDGDIKLLDVEQIEAFFGQVQQFIGDMTNSMAHIRLQTEILGASNADRQYERLRHGVGLMTDHLEKFVEAQRRMNLVLPEKIEKIRRYEQASEQLPGGRA
jgi:hypothetical protein